MKTTLVLMMLVAVCVARPQFSRVSTLTESNGMLGTPQLYPAVYVPVSFFIPTLLPIPLYSVHDRELLGTERYVSTICNV